MAAKLVAFFLSASSFLAWQQGMEGREEKRGEGKGREGRGKSVNSRFRGMLSLNPLSFS